MVMLSGWARFRSNFCLDRGGAERDRSFIARSAGSAATRLAAPCRTHYLPVHQCGGPGGRAKHRRRLWVPTHAAVVFGAGVSVRDCKTRGFGVQKSGLVQGARLERLLLGRALAYVLLLSVGRWVVKRGWRRRVDTGPRQRWKVSLFQRGVARGGSMSRKQQLADQVVAEYGILHGAVQAATALHGALARGVEANANQAISRIESDHAAAIRQNAAKLEQDRQKAVASVETAIRQAGPGALPWKAGHWATHVPPTAGSLPASVRLGEMIPPPVGVRFPAFPAVLPIIGRRHVLVSFEDAYARPAAGILESLAWRIAALSAPGTYRFVLMDPLDRGLNLASLLKLPEQIRGPKIYCQDDEIEAAFQQLARDVEEVIQRRLLNTYQDIEAYNAANPNTPVPYRFLIIAGFPKGVSGRAADLLASIARTGRRAGCYILGGVVRGMPPPHGFDWPSFQKTATYIRLKGSNQIEWDDADFANLPVQPDGPPPDAVITHLAKTIGPLVAAAATSVLPFREIAVRKANWWAPAHSSADGLLVDIGLDESGSRYELGIGQALSQHTLVG